MRTINNFFTYIFYLLFIMNFSNISFGLDIEIPKKTFYLHINGKYSNQWLRIFQEKNKWICQTESMPYIELKTNPTENFDFNKLNQAEAPPQDCKDFVIIKNNLYAKPQSYRGCFSDKSINELIRTLNKECRLF